jgi:phosphatidylglycerophosphate synthase
MRRRYGDAAARRFRVGLLAALVVQQSFVEFALRHSGSRGRVRHTLTLVDVMTLSRGWAAALLAGLTASGVRDRRGPAGWTGWLALLYGAILCDWLDGPIARHLGTSEVGALLDREADSWLTLCAAGGAVTWGALPAAVAVPPLLRYALLFDGLRSASHADLHGDEPPWVRHTGIAQMLLFIAATAPFRGRVTSRLVRLAAPLQTPVQLCSLLLQHRRLQRG